ncbi:hypothetical protein EV421DRAFT_1993872 [Armillaria borealis]|uniref:Glycoside hydrolase family 76 protein n=1 Tax=Armillaria borealis TaxID=47425 RepID=A0AA39MGX0_9AGAR|nr:hypothetical protein EV421DRAFT_1993872 [Armillaria borealis]
MHPVFIWTLCTLSLYSVAAQDLKPPATWRSTNITRSRDDRISIATVVLETAIQRLNWTDGQFSDGRYEDAGTLYAQMVELDRLTNQTKYKHRLKHYFNATELEKPSFLAKQVSSVFKERFLVTDFSMIAARWAVRNYGYAAARAYTTYGDLSFLAFAATSWASARQYTISTEQAASGTMETKQFTLASSCSNTTLAGGTYFITDPNDSRLDSLASGMFLVVSALLAEATSSQMYIDAAVESADFIRSLLLNPSHTVWTGIQSNSNRSSSCSVNYVISPCGSGTIIEGLAILDGIRHNSSTESLLRNTSVAVATDPLWQGVDGVYKNSNDHSIGGHCIVRALASLYEQNNTSSDLQEYIKEYIGVQYNSILDNATSSSDSGIYESPWTGSSGTLFNSAAQTSALTVLLSAIQLVDEPPSSNLTDGNPASTVTPTSSAGTSLPPQPSRNSSVIPTSSVGTPLAPQSPPTSSVNPVSSSGSASSAQKGSAGIIVGSVFGGITLFAALIVGALFLRKLHRQRSTNPSVVDASSAMITPFMATQNIASPGILGEQYRRNRVKSARFPGVAMGGEPPSRAADNGSVGIPRVNVRTEPTTAPGNQVGSTDNPPAGGRREYTLLEELLRSLNDLISRDRWNAEELPPDYHEGQAM